MELLDTRIKKFKSVKNNTKILLKASFQWITEKSISSVTKKNEKRIHESLRKFQCIETGFPKPEVSKKR